MNVIRLRGEPKSRQVEHARSRVRTIALFASVLRDDEGDGVFSFAQHYRHNVPTRGCNVQRFDGVTAEPDLEEMALSCRQRDSQFHYVE